jgi:DNA-binding transcriptional ArsR family regulator
MTTKKRSYDLNNRSTSAPGRLAATRTPNLFGTVLRAQILTLVAGLERTYPRELARLVERPISEVQRGVAALERAGVLASRPNGKQREVSLNPDFIAAKELSGLLQALLERDPHYRARLAKAARRRPRRSGKPL